MTGGRLARCKTCRQNEMYNANHDDETKWLERLTANTKVATVLDSISQSSGTVESEGAAGKTGLTTVLKLEKSTFKQNVYWPKI
jgi:hypothetical protein